MKYDSAKFVVALDLIGIFVFAVEGAMAAIDNDLDLLGLMVLAFSTALAGGLIRDVLIGAVPPGALRDWRYATTAFVSAAVVFGWYDLVNRIPYSAIVIADAAGLSLFAVAGAAKALNYNMPPFIAILMGGITGVGGGTVRDILLSRVPTVLWSDIYATAALAGAAVMVAGLKLRLPPALMTVIGAVACFLLRVVSVRQHWSLPRIMH
jgi:uncharacterized membrane protein YeiH